MFFPKTLSKGDEIAIIAPSSIPSPRQLEKGIEWIRSFGISISLKYHEISDKESYLAANDEVRLNSLQAALDSPKYKAVWISRGGYGLTRIIDRIDWSGFQIYPKWIIGFSDVTAILNACYNRGVASLHAPMVASLNGQKFELEQFLFKRKTESFNYQIYPVNSPQPIEGRLVGGNLSLIADAIGTQEQVNTMNEILFLEEINEPLYRIDRMLTHLRRAGMFNNIQAICFGDFSGWEKHDMAKLYFSFEDYLKWHFKEDKFPIFSSVPAGHILDNRPLVIGGEYAISQKNDEWRLRLKKIDISA